jgi:hypothetical protein
MAVHGTPSGNASRAADWLYSGPCNSTNNAATDASSCSSCAWLTVTCAGEYSFEGEVPESLALSGDSQLPVTVQLNEFPSVTARSMLNVELVKFIQYSQIVPQ